MRVLHGARCNGYSSWCGSEAGGKVTVEMISLVLRMDCSTRSRRSSLGTSDFVQEECTKFLEVQIGRSANISEGVSCFTTICLSSQRHGECEHSESDAFSCTYSPFSSQISPSVSQTKLPASMALARTESGVSGNDFLALVRRRRRNGSEQRTVASKILSPSSSGKAAMRCIVCERASAIF